MAFAPRTRADIRDSLLAAWAARYTALGQTLLTVYGSDAYLLADALSVQLEALEAQAANQTAEILPDTASEDGLARHGEVYGVDRNAATAAVVPITVTGAASATINFGAATLTGPNGLVYAPSASSDGSGTSVVLDGSGDAAAYATCRTAGTAGNLSAGATLTWSSAPTSADPTVTTSGVPAFAGTDEEAATAWAARIRSRLQERPASGNRADWRAWATESSAESAIADAYVYPLVEPTGPTSGVLGCVTIVCVGPPATGSDLDDPETDRRIPGGAALDAAAAYVEGGFDGTQRRPVTMAETDYGFVAPLEDTLDIELEIENTSAEFPWSGSLTTNATSSALTLNFAGSVPAITAGTWVAVEVGTTLRRGGYQLCKVASRTSTTIVLDASTPLLDVALPSGRLVFPAPTNWAQIRDVVISYIDALAPGDTGVSGSLRFPPEGDGARSVLRRNALAAAVINADIGVLDANVATPGVNIEPAALTVVRLGTLVIVPV